MCEEISYAFKQSKFASLEDGIDLLTFRHNANYQITVKRRKVGQSAGKMDSTIKIFGVLKTRLGKGMLRSEVEIRRTFASIQEA